ncbi:MAG: hypothetical protein AAGJ11_11790 [Bacteroidota bacterium]
MRDHTFPAPAFHAVALVAAARAAVNAARAVDDRRMGRDASEQEPEAPVRIDLTRLGDRVSEFVVRLRLRVVAGAPDAEAAALAQAFEDRLLLDDAAQTLGRAHQKLMSLYPAVEDALVEDTRVLAAEAARHAHADDLEAGLDRFTARLADWRDRLGDALA